MKPSNLLTFVLSLGAIAFAQVVPSDVSERDSPIFTFTIEVRARQDGGVSRHSVGRFSEATWDALWVELGVTKDMWIQWNSEVQTVKRHVPIAPNFSQLSWLAYIDEGPVHFKPRELREDCLGVAQLAKTEGTRRLIADLLEAATLALNEENSDVVVHPFGPYEDSPAAQ